MKRARPWKVPACYDGTHNSWRAEDKGTRAMYQARQRRMERKAIDLVRAEVGAEPRRRPRQMNYCHWERRKTLGKAKLWNEKLGSGYRCTRKQAFETGGP